MTSKIDFYREVLAIEPGSRVFFPLAQLLRQEGLVDEAMDVLRSGIGYHPDHLEAKFLLVELLSGQNRLDEAGAVFEGLAALLSHYPSVWTLWASKATGLSSDAALALRFLAAAFQGKELSWMGVLEKGLQASTESAVSVAPTGAAPGGGSWGSSVDLSGDNASAVVPGDEDPQGFTLRGADEVIALAQRIEALEKRTPLGELPAECAPESSAVVKTRTMAELLAKHGDYASALEIYEELARITTSDQERQQIAARIQELQTQAATGSSPAKPVEPDRPKAKVKLVSMLEALANRLDARATA